MLRWDVDDRRPTLWTRAYVRGMWAHRDKEAFEGEEHTLGTARRKQAEGDAPPTRWTRAACRLTARRVAGMTVWTALPRGTGPRARVLYLHGGGYVHPLTPDYWRLVRALTRAPAEVVVPAYPLAPDATVDDVVAALLEVARAACDDDLPLIVMGDSAGGALTLVLTRHLCEGPGPRPALAVPLSPWLDATLSDAEVDDLEASDPMLAESGLRAAGRWWARPRSPRDPLVSPVHAGLRGLPPVHLFIGDRDILRPAVDDLAERVRAEGSDLHVHEVPAMFHVWMTRFIPEAARTRRELARLVGAAGTPAAAVRPGG
jgi:acetyl esterase/lipase